MITITNFWGLFFSFGLPIIVMLILAYGAGLEDGQAKRRKKKSIWR